MISIKIRIKYSKMTKYRFKYPQEIRKRSLCSWEMFKFLMINLIDIKCDNISVTYN